MAMQGRTWWFDKKTWNQGVRDGSRLIFWGIFLSAFANLLLRFLVQDDPLAIHIGNGFNAVAACIAVVGWWQLTRPVDGLDGSKTTVMVILSRRIVLFWAVCALIVGVEWVPSMESWGHAPFIGKQVGRALSIGLGYVYLLQIFILTKHPGLAKASLALGILYVLTYIIEVLLLFLEPGDTLIIRTNLAFAFETGVGILSLGILWQVHAAVTPKA